MTRTAPGAGARGRSLPHSLVRGPLCTETLQGPHVASRWQAGLPHAQTWLTGVGQACWANDNLGRESRLCSKECCDQLVMSAQAGLRGVPRVLYLLSWLECAVPCRLKPLSSPCWKGF